MKKQMVYGALIVVLLVLAACGSSPSPSVQLPDADERLLDATQDGNLSGVRAALDAGANVNARNSYDQTPLMIASVNDDLEIVKYLVERGADISLQDKAGDTVFDYSEFIHPAIFEYLCSLEGAEAVLSSAHSSYEPSEFAETASSSSVQSDDDLLSDEDEAALAQMYEAINSTIENGRYRLSGGNKEISFTGIGDYGPLSYTDSDGNRYTGVYSISGDRLSLNIQGLGRFLYTVTSRTTFSSPDEDWSRVGY
jgi:predicted small lipoprotein YifL